MRWWCLVASVCACGFDSNVASGEGAQTRTSGTDAASSSASTQFGTASTDEPTTAVDTDTGADSTTAPATASTGAAEGSSSTGEPEPFVIGQFGEAMPIVELNSSDHDDDPTLRADLREIYFASHRGGQEAIYRAVRASAVEPWDAPELVDFLDSGVYETTPELSLDGRTLVFSAQAGSDVDLYVVTRDDVDSVAWSTPQPITELNTVELGEIGLVLTEDALVGYFCSRTADLQVQDIFRATRDDPDGSFDEPMVAMPFGSEDSECNPWIDPSGTTIVFAGLDRQDPDLMWARGGESGFDSPQVIEELATMDPENDPWLSPDGELIVFSRHVEGRQELYWAQRER